MSAPEEEKAQGGPHDSIPVLIKGNYKWTEDFSSHGVMSRGQGATCTSCIVRVFILT